MFLPSTGELNDIEAIYHAFHSITLLLFLSAATPSLNAIIKEPNLKIDIQISTASDALPAERESHPTGGQEPSTLSIGDVNTIDGSFTLQLAGHPVGSSDQDTIHANYYPFTILTWEKAIAQPYFTLINGTLRQGNNIVARYYAEGFVFEASRLFVVDPQYRTVQVLWKVATAANGQQRTLVLAKVGGK